MIDLNIPISICPNCNEIFIITVDGVKCGCTKREENAITAMKQLIERNALVELRMNNKP